MIPPKSKLLAAAGRVAAAFGRFAGVRRADFDGLGEHTGDISRSMNAVDGALGIKTLPAMRTLLSHNKDDAKRLLRAGLNGHYGRPGLDGKRLYLDIQDVTVYDHGKRGWGPLPPSLVGVARRVELGGKVYVGRPQHQEVGRLSLNFTESKQGLLTVRAHHVRLDESVQGRAFTHQMVFSLRDYFRRSGVDHVKIYTGLDDGGRGWAGVFNWDPQRVLENRRLMIGHVDEVLSRGGITSVDRALLEEVRREIAGDPALWRSTGELRKLLDGQFMQGSKWYGHYRL